MDPIKIINLIDLSISGFPDKVGLIKQNGTPHAHFGKLVEIVPGALGNQLAYYHLLTMPGMSGSTIWQDVPGSSIKQACAIHVGYDQEEEKNFATVRTEELIDWSFEVLEEYARQQIEDSEPSVN